METMEKDTLILGGKEFHSRFILGSGKFSQQLIRDVMEYGGSEIATIALRRANADSKENILDFYISNFYEKYSREEQSHKIGLQNAKTKLDLLYPQKYELNISDEKNQYTVHLKINLKAYELLDSR